MHQITGSEVTMALIIIAAVLNHFSHSKTASKIDALKAQAPAIAQVATTVVAEAEKVAQEVK